MERYEAPSLSLASGGEIYMGSEFSDSISLLDVLHANEFKGKHIDPAVAKQTEINFYRGAPPQWLNFYLADQGKSDGAITPFIKRDGYNELLHHIQKRRKGFSTSTVKLLHQPGCGGTTLAMQVLWDLRRTLRGAVLMGPTSDITAVASEVINLFTAGRRGNQNTVLLLLNNEQISERLQDSIMTELANQAIVAYMPVVIILTCVRQAVIGEKAHVVLRKELSDVEKQQFEEKRKDLSRRYINEHKLFHGFNIIQTNFSEAYVQEACAILKDVRLKKRPRKVQIASFLSLLNAYVTGSYLQESQCQEFLGVPRQDPIHGGPSFEERMEPFSHLIITFTQRVGRKQERNVRMAHHMIAEQCTQLMAKAGVSRSDIARDFLHLYCGDQAPTYLVPFIKDMLTKREKKRKEKGRNKDSQRKQTEGEESQESLIEEEVKERFSTLILDIQSNEGSRSSVSVLKIASSRFIKDPFFPQALARFYYLELKDYIMGEHWAKIATERAPNNSFIADTLGQVHKHHLSSKVRLPTTPRDILQLAMKAIEAFKAEERIAETEQGTDTQGDGMANVSHIFNDRGLIGYVKIANMVYDSLVEQNQGWREVLTKTASLDSLLKSLGDKKLYKLRYKDLINSLKDEVERKYLFFESYLTYSKPGVKNDPAYIRKEILTCYQKYVGTATPRHFKQKTGFAIQKLKEQMAVTFSGLLSCLDEDHKASQLQQITRWWWEILQSKHRDRCNPVDDYILKDSVNKYILANILLHHVTNTSPYLANFQHVRAIWKKRIGADSRASVTHRQGDAPEQYMLVLLLLWPKREEQNFSLDFCRLIQLMHGSYESEYEKHLRSRNLRPLLFLGKGEDLSQVVHRRILDNLSVEENERPNQDFIDEKWRNDDIFKDPRVQDRLLKLHGVVRNYKVYVSSMGKEIGISAHLRGSVWRSGYVSFYLGFNIRGPLAFGIQYEYHQFTRKHDKVEAKQLEHHHTKWVRMSQLSSFDLDFYH